MIVIVGAGIAGLLACQTLKRAGKDVLVVDKGRGVGGRMATRRVGAGVLDHGAQFFTVRSERFGALVAAWQAAGLVTEWTHGFADADGEWKNDGYPRYRGTNGMSAIPKQVAQGLDVRLGVRVASIRRRTDGWDVVMENGETLAAEALLLTPPVPQSLDLLSAGNVELAQEAAQALGDIRYERCIAALALLDRPSAIPEPGGVQIGSEPIHWIADNTQKGISPNAYAVTIHGAPQFSLEHWDGDRTAAGAKLIEAAAHWLGEAQVVEFQAHGWRYSQPINPYPEACLAAEPSLVFAGDAFGTPRVEGAALSGLAAADALLGR